MQFFLTLLASIASLSPYTLVGVHATKCAVCPKAVAGESLSSRCIDKYDSGTTCYYVTDWVQVTCDYNRDGHLLDGDTACPGSVSMTSSDCTICPRA